MSSYRIGERPRCRRTALGRITDFFAILGFAVLVFELIDWFAFNGRITFNFLIWLLEVTK